MISKEEYIRLYCDEDLAARGVYVLSQEKIFRQLVENPIKTLQDLDDYGINEAMAQNGIQDMQIMDIKTGEKRNLMHENKTQALKTPFLDKLIKEHREN